MLGHETISLEAFDLIMAPKHAKLGILPQILLEKFSKEATLMH